MAISIRCITSHGYISDDHVQVLLDMQDLVFGYTYKTGTAMRMADWWLAMDGGVVAGFCGLRIYREAKCAFLCLSGVSPGYRGLGLQRRMIRVRERLARKCRCERIITYTSPDNYWSANNLIRCGYTLYNPRWEWGVAHAYYFRKFLPCV
jgi:GNAT superfamily N-acetyltransferase